MKTKKIKSWYTMKNAVFSKVIKRLKLFKSGCVSNLTKINTVILD